MSDPVSSMDVEDVLSSIRRLVSEEAKATEPSRESPQLGRQTDIHEETENAASEAVSQINNDASIGQADVLAGVPPSNEISRQQPVAQDDAQVSFRHKTAAPRGGVDKKLVLTAALRVAEAENNGPQGSGDDVAEATSASERPRRPGHPHLRSVSDDASASGGPSDTANNAPDAGANDGADHRLGGVSRGNKLDFAPEDTLFERAKRAMESVKSTPIEPPAYVFDPEVKPTSPEVAERPVAPSPTPVEEMRVPEQAPDEGQNEVEVAAPIGTEASSEFIESAAATSASASPFSASGGTLDPAHAEAESDLEDDLPSVNFVEEEESILDEETLRDMVSEMVREELQGELGDRITRNVRKLVRREIQRALASREFE